LTTLEVTLHWNNGYVNSYTVTGGVKDSRACALRSAVESCAKLNSVDYFEIKNSNQTLWNSKEDGYTYE